MSNRTCPQSAKDVPDGSMGEETEPFSQDAGVNRAHHSELGGKPSRAGRSQADNSRLPPTERFVYATEMRQAARTVIGPRANALAGPPEHTVVRVEPGRSRILGARAIERVDES